MIGGIVDGHEVATTRRLDQVRTVLDEHPAPHAAPLDAGDPDVAVSIGAGQIDVRDDIPGAAATTLRAVGWADLSPSPRLGAAEGTACA